MRRRPRGVDGFLTLYKPRGITSMEAVRRVRRFTKQRHVGHGGTLDPLAEGVLPICFGQATRLMEYLVEDVKCYRLELTLGVTTDTYDAEGQAVEEADPSGITPEQVESALAGFRGAFWQTPPMYSALKRQGRRLYDLARAGIEVEREPRRVRVEHLEVVDFDPARLVLEVGCGRGLYLRSLAHDIGQALGCGGYLSALVRLRAGAFHLEDSVKLEELEERSSEGRWEELLQPLDLPLLFMKALRVSPAGERLLRNGQAVSHGPPSSYTTHLESCRAYSHDGRFLGVVRWDRSQGLWRPYKTFQPGKPSIHAPA